MDGPTDITLFPEVVFYMGLVEIKGDILDTDCKAIAHGVNCQGVMGSGVAKAISDKWPEVKYNYINYVKSHTGYPDSLLGISQEVVTSDNKLVYNLFTQQNYGRGKQVYLSYLNLTSAFSNMCDQLLDRNIDKIAMPKIGCGLAGGNWFDVKNMLTILASEEEVDIEVYYL